MQNFAQVNQWDGIKAITCDVDNSTILQNGTTTCFTNGQQVFTYLIT